MGCTSSRVTTSHQIAVQLKRLKHDVSLKIEKLKLEGLSQEKILVGEFKKQGSYRAVAAENSMASDITLKINKIQIYDIVKCHIQKVSEYSHHLDFPDKFRSSLEPSLKEILYSNSILKDQNISHFCRSVQSRFPSLVEATDEEISSELMRYYKKNEFPSNQMVNEYLLKVVNQESLDLAVVNSVGHEIRYGK